MHYICTVVGVGAVALMIGMVYLVKWYDAWIERQSPVGVWIARSNDILINLQFEGGPREGLYRQITYSNGIQSREFGHWMVRGENLQMLILATDVKNHPRFAVDTKYEVAYWSFRQPVRRIRIHGPERHKLVYRRAKPGSSVVFDTDIDPTTKSDPSPSA